MAIVKVGTYRNPPEDITDYEAIVAHLEAYTRQIGNQGMILTEWTNTTNAPKIAMGSYISHGGVLYVVEDEDYTISFPTTFSQVWYIVVQTSGESLSIGVAFDPSSYSWNAIYNGLYDSLGKQLLPYKVWALPAISVPQWNKYKLLNTAHIETYKSLWVDYLGNLESAGIYANGPIECESVNTGDMAMTFNQGVRTTDNVIFASIRSKQKIVDINGDTLTDYTENAIYSALLPYIDAIGGTLKAGGYIENTAGTIRISVSYLKRGSSYIRIHGTPVVGSATSAQVNSGGSNTYKYRIII